MTETFLRETPRRRLSEADRLAMEIHMQEGHPEGYDGPCWGPTLEQRERAKKILKETKDE